MSDDVKREGHIDPGRRWLWSLLLLELCVPGMVAGERFARLEVGSQIYTNATVLSTAASHIFISHAGGMNSVRVLDLAPELQAQLGYEPAGPGFVRQKLESARQLQPHSYLQPWTERITAELQKRGLNCWPAIRELKQETQLILGAGLLALYLLGCHCGQLICRKAGQEPGLWIWLPVVQIFPLLKAAGMPSWLCLPALIPGLNLLVGAVWCLKICRARQKSFWLALFLLFPPTSLLALLYLAFSKGLKVKEETVAQFHYT